MTSRYRVPLDDLQSQVAVDDQSTLQPVRDAVPAPPLADPAPYGDGATGDADGD